jgi:hypothetical protein
LSTNKHDVGQNTGLKKTAQNNRGDTTPTLGEKDPSQLLAPNGKPSGCGTSSLTHGSRGTRTWVLGTTGEGFNHSPTGGDKGATVGFHGIAGLPCPLSPLNRLAFHLDS